MSREDELYKLCHNATKISINNEMFSVDGCCEECVWLCGDEYGEETIIYFADMVDAEKSGDSIEFYNLHKMEDKHKSSKVLEKRQWYSALQNADIIGIRKNTYLITGYSDEEVFLHKLPGMQLSLQIREDEAERKVLSYKEAIDLYKKGQLKVYKLTEVDL